ncbi:MAG: GNAT family N-acetyltransferase [Candidatus Woesearchaeota archaeon]
MISIKTARLFMRPLEEGDAFELSNIANNKKIWENLTDAFPHPYTLDKAKDWITFNKQKSVPENFFVLDDIGAVGMVGFSIKEDYFEIGYWLAEHVWGRGYATELVFALSKYLFDNYEISKILAKVYVHNLASCRVLEKCGFVKQDKTSKTMKAGKELDEFIYVLNR